MNIADFLPILAKPGQPDTLYRALDRRTKDLVGHQLFTLLYVDGNDVVRVYSNNLDAYPLSGRKPMGRTPWGDLVLKAGKPFIARNADGIRWAFFDHELLAGLGLASAINIPVVYDGICIGSINLLDAELHYADEHVAALMPYAPLLIPAFKAAQTSAG